jgi:hypothetical protein
VVVMSSRRGGGRKVVRRWAEADASLTSALLPPPPPPPTLRSARSGSGELRVVRGKRRREGRDGEGDDGGLHAVKAKAHLSGAEGAFRSVMLDVGPADARAPARALSLEGGTSTQASRGRLALVARDDARPRSNASSPSSSDHGGSRRGATSRRAGPLDLMLVTEPEEGEGRRAHPRPAKRGGRVVTNGHEDAGSTPEEDDGKQRRAGKRRKVRRRAASSEGEEEEDAGEPHAAAVLLISEGPVSRVEAPAAVRRASGQLVLTQTSADGRAAPRRADTMTSPISSEGGVSGGLPLVAAGRHPAAAPAKAPVALQSGGASGSRAGQLVLVPAPGTRTATAPIPLDESDSEPVDLTLDSPSPPRKRGAVVVRRSPPPPPPPPPPPLPSSSAGLPAAQLPRPEAPRSRAAAKAKAKPAKLVQVVWEGARESPPPPPPGEAVPHWFDRYAPTDPSQLAWHKPKIAELTEWMRDAAAAATHAGAAPAGRAFAPAVPPPAAPPKRLLFLIGSPGIGKSTAGAWARGLGWGGRLKERGEVAGSPPFAPLARQWHGSRLPSDHYHPPRPPAWPHGESSAPHSVAAGPGGPRVGAPGPCRWRCSQRWGIRPGQPAGHQAYGAHRRRERAAAEARCRQRQLERWRARRRRRGGRHAVGESSGVVVERRGVRSRHAASVRIRAGVSARASVAGVGVGCSGSRSGAPVHVGHPSLACVSAVRSHGKRAGRWLRRNTNSKGIVARLSHRRPTPSPWLCWPQRVQALPGPSGVHAAAATSCVRRRRWRPGGRRATGWSSRRRGSCRGAPTCRRRRWRRYTVGGPAVGAGGVPGAGSRVCSCGFHVAVARHCGAVRGRDARGAGEQVHHRPLVRIGRGGPPGRLGAGDHGCHRDPAAGGAESHRGGGAPLRPAAVIAR